MAIRKTTFKTRNSDGSYDEHHFKTEPSQVDGLSSFISALNKTLTIKKNNTSIGTFDNSADKTINITVPTSAVDVGALPSTTKYAADVTMSYATATGILTISLKDQDGNLKGTAKTVNLPLEIMVESGSVKTCTTANVPVQGYAVGDKYIDLVLNSGAHIYILATDLVDQISITTSGSGNAVTALAITGSTLTVTKGKTFVETSRTIAGIALSSNITAAALIDALGVPAAQVNSDWNSTSGISQILNKPSIPKLIVSAAQPAAAAQTTNDIWLQI